MRNAFNASKITYIEKSGKVIYHSKMQKGKNKKNFIIIYSKYPKSQFKLTNNILKNSFTDNDKIIIDSLDKECEVLISSLKNKLNL